MVVVVEQSLWLSLVVGMGVGVPLLSLILLFLLFIKSLLVLSRWLFSGAFSSLLVGLLLVVVCMVGHEREAGAIVAKKK